MTESATTSTLPRKVAKVRRIVVRVIAGPAGDHGIEHASTGDRLSIGSHESNDLVVQDPAVSRFHCELVVEPLGPRLRDLGSRNGTVVDGLDVRDALLHDGCRIHVGRTILELA